MSGTESPNKQKRATHRSPSYPMFSLGEAISKARVIYENDKRAFTSPDVIARHLGFAQHIGGPGGRTMSALRQYGLLDESGGKSRISDRAYTLIQFPEGSPERTQSLKAAIREPNLFRELLSEFDDSLPSDEALRSNLLKRGFNPDVIDDVISVLRDTVSLDQDKNVEYSSIRVGDYVQWTSQGADQFDKPRRFTRLSEDGKFGFVEGEKSGFLIGQLSKAEPPEQGRGGEPINRPQPPKPGMNSDVFTLKEGDVVLQWPNRMSPESYEDFKDWIELITRKAKRSVTDDETAKND